MRRVPVGRFTASVGSSVPDKLRLPRRETRQGDTEEVERNGILFNFCQSRREEDNSLTGSKLECGGEEKPCVFVCVSVCMLVCV